MPKQWEDIRREKQAEKIVMLEAEVEGLREENESLKYENAGLSAAADSLALSNMDLLDSSDTAGGE